MAHVYNPLFKNMSSINEFQQGEEVGHTYLPAGEPSIVSMEVMGSLAVQVKSTKPHNYAHWRPQTRQRLYF